MKYLFGIVGLLCGSGLAYYGWQTNTQDACIMGGLIAGIALFKNYD